MAALLQSLTFLLVLSLALPSCAVGGGELAIIALVILLLFGGSRLPKLMRGLGSGVHEFKKGLKEGDRDDEERPKKPEDRDA